jgi:hypothetical protein
MKMKITVLAIMLCVASTSTSFAGGRGYGHHGGYNHGYYRGPTKYVYHDGGHDDLGLGIVIGAAGGLLLGSALTYSPPPPPPTVVYAAPYPVYSPPPVVVQQPKICVEDRVVSGEWQISQYDGRQIWVSFPNPVTRRVQVPCY